jgi:hypothetical protein
VLVRKPKQKNHASGYKQLCFKARIFDRHCIWQPAIEASCKASGATGGFLNDRSAKTPCDEPLKNIFGWSSEVDHRAVTATETDLKLSDRVTLGYLNRPIPERVAGVPERCGTDSAECDGLASGPPANSASRCGQRLRPTC